MVCCDKTYTVDRKILLTKADFTAKSDGDDSLYIIAVTELLSHICSVCGFAGYSDSTGMLGSTIKTAKSDNVLERSCREVLDELSESCGGCWVCQGDTGADAPSGVLVLAAMGGAVTASEIAPEKYSEIELGGIHRFSSIIMTSGSDTFTAGGEGTAYSSLEIDTPYASAAAAGAIYNRLIKYEYRAWECAEMLVNYYPAPPCGASFGKKRLIANHCTLNLTSCGMFAALGANAVSEDEIGYLNRTDREMRSRYRIGDIMKNVAISKDSGITYVYRDEVNGKTESYGFETEKGGITTYDGVMTDRIMPDKTEVISKTEHHITYGLKTFALTWKLDDKGNKTDFKYTEVKK